MLKVRLIPTIILKGEMLVQSVNFNKFLPIGKVDAAIEFFTNWDVDEIAIIDIDATLPFLYHPMISLILSISIHFHLER